MTEDGIIYVYKANDPEEAPDLVLRATAPMSTRFTDHKKALAFYREEGRRIVDALRASLPTGTLDAVLVELLDARRSTLVRSWDEPGPPYGFQDAHRAEPAERE